MFRYYRLFSIVFLFFILPYILCSGSTLAQVPLPPVLTEPLNNAANVSLTPELRWSFVLPLGVVLSYRLQVSEVNSFSTTVFDDQSVTSNHSSIPEGTLNEKTLYYWRVNATVRIGFITMTTAYSSAFSFTTLGLTGVSQLSTGVPGRFMLYANYPNPFNPSTNIKFDLKGISEAHISIYNSSGKEVRSESLGTLSPGTYEYQWNAEGLPSGTYYCRFTARLVESAASEFVKTIRMVLVK